MQLEYTDDMTRREYLITKANRRISFLDLEEYSVYKGRETMVAFHKFLQLAFDTIRKSIPKEGWLPLRDRLEDCEYQLALNIKDEAKKEENYFACVAILRGVFEDYRKYVEGNIE